jgi:nucleotide-binding universal stress UspA family protein
MDRKGRDTGAERLLICLDGSEASRTLVRYVAQFAERGLDATLHLLHVLPPFPAEMLEFRGAEDPAEEVRLDAAQQRAQEKWIADAKVAAEAFLEDARALLVAAGVPRERIVPAFGEPPYNAERLVDRILERAEETGCRTIAVGRESLSWGHELFHARSASELIRRAEGHAVWVVS